MRFQFIGLQTRVPAELEKLDKMIAEKFGYPYSKKSYCDGFMYALADLQNSAGNTEKAVSEEWDFEVKEILRWIAKSWKFEMWA